MNINMASTQIVNSLKKDLNFFLHKDILIIGENNAGKSKLLKEVIKKSLNLGIYFIDSSNRKITTKRDEVIKTFENFDINKIIEFRMSTENFNKKDVFSSDTGNELVINEIIKNFSNYQSLFLEVLGFNMNIQNDQSDLSQFGSSEEIFINGKNLDIISDGYQAMLRILMEVEFAFKNNCNIVIIDEVNMNLDTQNSWEFIFKLKVRYPTIKFILTCHSLHTVLGLSNFDIIKINKLYGSIGDNLCEIFDSNDFDNIELVDRKLFASSGYTNKNDILLSNALKSIIHIGCLNEVDKQQINGISSPTYRQKAILDYINERSR